MAKCVVTGGAGFIGSHLVEGLVRSGHSVIAFDDLSSGRLANLGAVRSALGSSSIDAEIDFVEGDVLDRAALDAAVSGADCVFHQAAVSSVAQSVADPQHCQRTIVDGTLNVLTASRDAGVRRVVYAGSAAVYGDCETIPTDEEAELVPLSPYASAKLAGELHCQEFHRLYGLETVVLRYFNVFGPRQDPKGAYAAVIPLFIYALLEGNPIRIFGDGRQSRDFTYVGNAVNANLLAMHADCATGRAINVANGNRTDLLELVEILESLTGSKAELRFEDERAGDVRHSQASIERAREELGYAPALGLREGLERTLGAMQATS